MSVFTKKTLETGQVQYRKDGKLISNEERAKLDPALLEKLDIAPEGTKVPESDEVVATEENIAPEATQADTTEQVVEIHLERNLMINGKVYRGGYETELDDDGEVISEEPIKIRVAKSIADDLTRMDREHTTYERNLMRGQNKARHVPQVKDVR